YRTVSYDLRGHGQSEAATEDFSIDLFTEDLIAFMDHLELDKVTLCGLSIGGYIALNTVLKHPHRIEALVLCDTQCVADSTDAKEGRMRTIDTINTQGVQKYADETLKNLFAPASISKRKEQVNAVRETILQTPTSTLRSTLLALASRKETCSALSEIKAPTLVMVGKEDAITPPDAAEVIHKRIPGSVFCIIENSGHLCNLENTDEFNQQLKEFMSRVHKPERIAAR
ncbi:MAG: alpha/beta fold hydrolase, partial [Bacteroidia bacterium]